MDARTQNLGLLTVGLLEDFPSWCALRHRLSDVDPDPINALGSKLILVYSILWVIQQSAQPTGMAFEPPMSPLLCRVTVRPTKISFTRARSLGTVPPPAQQWLMVRKLLKLGRHEVLTSRCLITGATSARR
jgi:hypothetical protein